MILEALTPSAGSMIGTLFGSLLSLGLLVLFGFFLYWTVRFIKLIPSYLLRIAEALETIAEKLGEH